MGDRVAKRVNALTTHFLVDRNNLTGYAQIVEELSSLTGSLTVRRVYLYGLDLISQDQLLPNTTGGETWQTSFYHYDGLGTVRALSGTDGLTTDAYWYDAYGVLLNIDGTTPNVYLYTGEQWDADLEMYFLRARYLEPGSGRFWTLDSYEGRGGDPATLHKYLYVHGNPVMGIDPSGLFSIIELILQMDLQAVLRGGQAQGTRVLVKRGGCFALELVTETVIDTVVFEGLYLLVDENNVPYAGRSNDVNDRLDNHSRSGKLRNRLKDLLLRIPVLGASTNELRGLEEWLIQVVMDELKISDDASLKNEPRIGNQRHEIGKKGKGRANLSSFFKFCK